MKTLPEISKLNPCSEALDFRKEYNTFEDAWNNCPRGDWMLWIAFRLKVNKRKLTLAKGYCANTVIHLMKDERSVNAVKTAILYGRYKADDNDLKTAAYDAYAAAYANAYDAAAYAAADAYAYAAAAADYAADAYAYAAAYDAAAYAAADAYAYAAAAAAAADYAADAYADAYAYAADTKEKNQQQTADICRKYLTKDVMRLIKKL